MKQYYVYIPGDDSVQGPFPVAMIQNAYTQGIYNDAVMLQDVNGGDWVSIGSVFSKPVPPPPPVSASPNVPTSPAGNDIEQKKEQAGCGCGGLAGALLCASGFLHFVRNYYKRNNGGDNVAMDILCLVLCGIAVVGVIVALKEQHSKK
ncbi:MAG: hypothetical protein IKZ07_02025 [Akkermansia sp.]|jgi:hypothetical protein|nr:hypothetical protein [Akkermansia sp.]